MPATYRQACANGVSSCAQVPPGPIPAALRRPFRLTALTAGQSCPASPGRELDNGYDNGIALGGGPVRPLVEDTVDLRRRTVDIVPTTDPGWLGLKAHWVSGAAYQGPFVVRGLRLDRPGVIALRGSLVVGPLVVPPGATDNTSADGIRDVPTSLWLRAPGCYGLQVDGLTFSDTVVIHAVLPAAPGAG